MAAGLAAASALDRMGRSGLRAAEVQRAAARERIAQLFNVKRKVDELEAMRAVLTQKVQLIERLKATPGCPGPALAQGVSSVPATVRVEGVALEDDVLALVGSPSSPAASFAVALEGRGFTAVRVGVSPDGWGLFAHAEPAICRALEPPGR